MLDLTRQEKRGLIFLMVAGLLGTGILCYKNLRCQPRIEIISNRQIEKEIEDAKIININKASKYELVRLNGIGPILAGAIIEYRATHGGFKDKEELKNVKGIGRAKYEKIKEYIKLE